MSGFVRSIERLYRSNLSHRYIINPIPRLFTGESHATPEQFAEAGYGDCAGVTGSWFGHLLGVRRTLGPSVSRRTRVSAVLTCPYDLSPGVRDREFQYAEAPPPERCQAPARQEGR